MSVLSFPRIYFKGYASWDPCTFNNNDFAKFPTFDAAQAALNWPFLATQNPPITPENFTQTFRPYAIKLQNDSIDNPAGARVPCEWNMFGSHAAAFVQYNNYKTEITGGALAYNKPSTNDPLIGTTIKFDGDNQYSAPKLVDTNPSSFWSSQIYYGSFTVGSGDYSVSGSRAVRMSSRWINLGRIYDATGKLTQPAASVGCCFQACIPNSGIAWNNGTGGASSELLAALQKASTQPDAQGVMIRFTAYVNMYFCNGILNDITQQARNYEQLATLLAAAWDQWNNGNGDTSEFFSQPCYSHVVGSIGVWNVGELASVPLGRYLSAQAPVTPVGGQAPTQLGPAAAQVNSQANLLSLDLGSAIPEVAIPGTPASNLEKVNLGILTVGIQTGNQFVTIGELGPSQYGKAAYEAFAGIVDLPIPTSITPQQLAQGLLAIKSKSGGQSVNALTEQAFCAQTDSRGIYLDQGCQQEFQITVLKQGAPAAGAKVLLAQYDQNLNLVPSVPPQYIGFTLGDQRVVNSSGGSPVATIAAVVTADENGIATAGVSAQTPGFPVVAFFPFSGEAWPAPPPSLFPPGNAFYTTIRVLPFDDALPLEFLDLWNSTQDPALAWKFIYDRILYVYDMIFSVMLNFVNLGSQADVEKNAEAIAAAIAAPLAAEGTGAMPVTRDLSHGKRLTLQHYLKLIRNRNNVATPGLESVESQ